MKEFYECFYLDHCILYQDTDTDIVCKFLKK